MAVKRIDDDVHRRQALRVHELASDFQLIDLWELELERRSDEHDDTFGEFHRLFIENGVEADGTLTAALFTLRFLLGRLLGWDDDDAPLPIPGCTETSIVERLTTDDIRRSLDQPGSMPREGLRGPRVVYRFEREALMEVSNATIHALLHTSLVTPGDRPCIRIAVYTKSRGIGSTLYMGLIRPFRHYVVYPAWLGRLERRWANARR